MNALLSTFALAGVFLLAACTTIQLPPGPVAEAGVAFSTTGEIGAYAQGVADPASGRAMTPDDPARVASVSKMVTAIGVMTLVDRGLLDLDRDVSDYLGWPLRNPAFPDRPINLRMLMSHTSSLREHDDNYAIPLGGSLRAIVADRATWDSAHGPGAGYFHYTNLNFPVVGSIVERVTGERFDRFMRRAVLDPMRIDACYNWPTCSDSAVSRAVALYQRGKPVKDDLRGRRPDCPVQTPATGPCDLSRWVAGENGALFAPQGGLRISVRGLARVGRMLLGRGTLDGVTVLSSRAVETMLAPQWRFDGRNGDSELGFYCSYGLAAQQIATHAAGCRDDPAADGIARVGHAGDAYGVRSGIWIDRARGTGIAYIVTGLDAQPALGRSAFFAAEESAFRKTLALTR